MSSTSAIVALTFEDDALRQITHDHTVPEDMVRRGELQPEQVAQHPLRHVITNVVGGIEAGVFVEATRSMCMPAIACCCVPTG